MCQYVSFCVSADLWAPLRLYFGALDSHAGIEAGWALTPGSYREAEWAADDDGSSLTVRVEHGEDESAYRAAILAQYPDRTALLAGVTEGRANGSRCWYRDGQRIAPPATADAEEA